LIGAGASERTLQSNWMKYRRVAHLWATANLRPDLTCVPGGLGEFVALAQQLRSEAGAYIPTHDSEPLLPLSVSVSLDLIDPNETAQRFGPHWIDHIRLSPDFARLMGTD
jgi:hypothetical protein